MVKHNKPKTSRTLGEPFTVSICVRVSVRERKAFSIDRKWRLKINPLEMDWVFLSTVKDCVFQSNDSESSVNSTFSKSLNILFGEVTEIIINQRLIMLCLFFALLKYVVNVNLIYSLYETMYKNILM